MSALAFVSDHGRFRELHDELWTWHADLSIGPFPFGRRMAAVHADGRWLLLGPLVPDGAGLERLEARGDVAELVVPTAFHNRFVRRAAGTWTRARIRLATGARPEGLPPDRVVPLGGAVPEPWSDVLDAIPIEGMPRVNETVFVHRPSRTLIVADLVFRITPDYPWTTRLPARLVGTYPGFGTSRMFRAMIRDRAAFRRSLDRILDHDFGRVLMAHGEIADAGGREAIVRLRERY